jgi:hypothetical protein
MSTNNVNDLISIVRDSQEEVAVAFPEPPEEAVDQLLAMGFLEEEKVRRALRDTDNNVERAAKRLLSSCRLPWSSR